MAFLGISVDQKTADLLKEIDIPGEKVSPNDFHITILCFEDNFPISEILKSIEAAYNVTKHTKPFKAKINKVFNFPVRGNNPVPIVAKVESSELQELRDKLAKEFDKNNIEFDKTHKTYVPHVTLSYSKKEIDDLKIENIKLDIKELVLWGGDYGEDRLVIKFPLNDKNKYSCLLHKINLFYKVANIDKPFDYQEKFDQILTISDSLLLGTMKNFIKNDDFLNYLISQPKDIDTLLHTIIEAVKYEIYYDSPRAIEIINFVKNSPLSFLFDKIKAHFMDNMSSIPLHTADVDAAVKLEDVLFDQQNIKTIFYKILNNYKNSDDVTAKETVNNLLALIYSKYLNEKTIWRIIRQIDPDTFSEENDDKVNIYKSEFNIDDVLKLLNKRGTAGINYSLFKDIVEKSNPKAQNVLRRMLWMRWRNQEYIDFMLDETMQPIDENSIPIKILDSDIIERAKHLGVNPNNKWNQQFTDYQIIPFPGTFKNIAYIK